MNLTRSQLHREKTMAFSLTRMRLSRWFPPPPALYDFFSAAVAPPTKTARLTKPNHSNKFFCTQRDDENRVAGPTKRGPTKLSPKKNGLFVPDQSLVARNTSSSSGSSDIPDFALQDRPIWLEMMVDFLQQKPRVVVLDVDSAPLPFLLDEPLGVVQDCGYANCNIPEENPLRTEEQHDVFAELLGCENLRYVHIPHVQLRRTVATPKDTFGFLRNRSEPLAVIGGTSTQSSQAQTILREEGFKKVCNVHTFKYLRKLLSVREPL